MYSLQFIVLKSCFPHMFVWSEFYRDIQKGLLLCKGNLYVPWCRVWDTNPFTCWVVVGTPFKEKPQACHPLLSVNDFLFSLLDWAADPSILKMRLSLAISFFILLSLWVEEACSKEKSSKKGKGKKKQYLCPSYVRSSSLISFCRAALLLVVESQTDYWNARPWPFSHPAVTHCVLLAKHQGRQRFGAWWPLPSGEGGFVHTSLHIIYKSETSYYSFLRPYMQL